MGFDFSLIENKIDQEALVAEIWDRGYFFEADDGIWYEVYVREAVKSVCPGINLVNSAKDQESFSGFRDLMVEHYKDDNQITFFVPHKEACFTLDALTNVFVELIRRSKVLRN